MEKLYCPECGNYLEGGDGSMVDCHCGWKQERSLSSDEDEIEQLRQRVQELEKEPSVESGGEFKTWWEIALHVGAWKNHELDYVHFGSEMAVRAFAIHLLKQRDKEESQLIQTIAKLTAERDKANQCWQIAEGRCDALLEANRIACEDLVERHDRIVELKQQRDELLAVVEMAYKVASEHDDRLPFDWAVYCEMLYQVIASVKEK